MEYHPLETIVKKLNELNIRYLLIGRQALIFYDAPVSSLDFDFWIHPDDKDKVYDYLHDSLGFEPTYDRAEKKPLVIFYGALNKIDVFFFRKITNTDGETLDIDECLINSNEIHEPGLDFFVRVPSIDDLLKLKKVQRETAQEEQKDAEDIAYLEARKKLM